MAGIKVHTSNRFLSQLSNHRNGHTEWAPPTQKGDKSQVFWVNVMDSDTVQDPHLVLLVPQFCSHTAPASSSFSCLNQAIANVHQSLLASCDIFMSFIQQYIDGIWSQLISFIYHIVRWYSIPFERIKCNCSIVEKWIYSWTPPIPYPLVTTLSYGTVNSRGTEFQMIRHVKKQWKMAVFKPKNHWNPTMEHPEFQ